MRTPDNIVAIWGAPRSGTTWLGQIFNSSPNTLFRFQPLFSYAFKDRISASATLEEISSFFYALTNTTDDFVLNGLSDQEAILLNFDKEFNPTHLVMKHVRYHHIMANLLEKFNDIKIVGLIRHPCATINSWINTFKEFDSVWNPEKEWRFAPQKNKGNIEEFYGFEKWKEVAFNFIKYANNYPNKFFLLNYGDLNHDPLNMIEKVFSFSGLNLDKQTIDFIEQSTSKYTGTGYSVFRRKGKDDVWRNQLSPLIIEEIHNDLKGSALEKYLDD